MTNVNLTDIKGVVVKFEGTGSCKYIDKFLDRYILAILGVSRSYVIVRQLIHALLFTVLSFLSLASISFEIFAFVYIYIYIYIYVVYTYIYLLLVRFHMAEILSSSIYHG